ncbi:unnamed protein product [Phytophthora fragariaefolia]|uniref:Unnamed protein product n=1 Tax=Phytophthora fragariaefolia TaxID=1490495 RepID=A0A9W7CVN1_9STRA|nr:unnamed protein product [Phytophthora fragariaefolia]
MDREEPGKNIAQLEEKVTASKERITSKEWKGAYREVQQEEVKYLSALEAEDIECNDAREGDDISESSEDYLELSKSNTGTIQGTDRGDDNSYEHVVAEFGLEDYAKELAFLPDLTEPAETKLDYTANNVQNPELSAEQASLIAVLKNHDKIMIASGNALPPPAYGVVCDIDVGGHAPIKQRARRIPLRQLKKLYEPLKGQLKAGLIPFSDSPWASPIVIVLKKNGLDIRLCIDYKLVNAVTMIMEYAIPLVVDLLTDLEAYLWFCSLDAASRFWGQ